MANKWPGMVVQRSFIKEHSFRNSLYFVMIVLVQLPSKCTRIFYLFSQTKMYPQQRRVVYQNLFAYDLALLVFMSIIYILLSTQLIQTQKLRSHSLLRALQKKLFFQIFVQKTNLLWSRGLFFIAIVKKDNECKKAMESF